MKKNISTVISILAIIAVLITTALPAYAAQPKTFEELVNAMELKPLSIQDAYPMGGADYNDAMRPQELLQKLNGLSNYQKLRTAYEHAVQYIPKDNHCGTYAGLLRAAFSLAGFAPYVYHADGECTTVDGGWTYHQWNAMEIGGQLYYFDSNIPGRYNGSADYYFAMSADNATVYRNIDLYEYEHVIGFMPGQGEITVNGESRYDNTARLTPPSGDQQIINGQYSFDDEDRIEKIVIDFDPTRYIYEAQETPSPDPKLPLQERYFLGGGADDESNASGGRVTTNEIRVRLPAQTNQESNETIVNDDSGVHITTNEVRVGISPPEQYDEPYYPPPIDEIIIDDDNKRVEPEISAGDGVTAYIYK